MKATLDADDYYMLLVDECPSGHSSRPVVDVPPQMVRRYARLREQLIDVEAIIAQHLVATRQDCTVPMTRGVRDLVRTRALAAP